MPRPSAKSSTGTTIAVETVEHCIYLIRDERVILDFDLAELYQVETKFLLRAVRRNSERFPADFTFQLSRPEFENLRCQIGTSSSWGGRRYPPYAFTEQGVAMLSSVLRSKRAAQVNVAIMRAFVRLRRMLTDHVELARKVDQMEKKYDSQFKIVFDALRSLMEYLPLRSRRKDGSGLHRQSPLMWADRQPARRSLREERYGVSCRVASSGWDAR